MENFPLGKLLANALLSCVLFHNIKKKFLVSIFSLALSKTKF